MASSSSSSSSAFIPLHKTQLHPRMHSSSSSSSSSPPNPPKQTLISRHPHKHLLLILSLSLLPFSIYLFSLYHTLHLPSSSTFGLVLEIADFHSQIRVFRSLNEVSGTPFSGESSDVFRVENEMGSDGLGRVVRKLVGFAKGKVPKSEWKDTRVQVMVTGQGESEKVLEDCRRVLRSSGFMFRDDWASVLRGQQEGLYHWVAVNYALGYIGKKPEETAGVIVLGRSAMQVSFASDESLPSKFSKAIRMAGVTYNLHTQSLKQFGQDAIWKSLQEKNSQEIRSLTENGEEPVTDACIPKGFGSTSVAEKLVKSPAGNFSSCKSDVLALLIDKQGKCADPPCELAPSIFTELEQKPHPQQKFFLVSELQGLVRKASVTEVEAAGQHFCEEDWDHLKKQHHNIDDIYLSKNCFSHAFMANFLLHSFGIPLDDKRVGFAAGSTPVDWRLGAFIAQTIMEPIEEEVEDIETEIIGNESVSYFVLFAILLALVMLAAYFVIKLRKPQLKTIYDLEKGCYIVTRLPK